MNCFRCGSGLDLKAGIKVSRSEECPKCFSDIHCCLMCSFHNKNAANECNEPSAEPVKEKDKKNFCDFFTLKNATGVENKREDQFAKAMSLFKK